MKRAYLIIRMRININLFITPNGIMNELRHHSSGSGIFVQIGAGAGDLDARAKYRDGFTEFIKSLPKDRIKKIILVEPNPFNIPLLKECWKDFSDVYIYELAIVPSKYCTSEMRLYYCAADAPHYQTASIDKNHVLKHYGGHDLDYVTVKTDTLNNFLNETVSNNVIELLAMDIEGIDADVLLEIDFNIIKAKFISFEYIHLGDRASDVIDYLVKYHMRHVGYGVDHNNFDYLFKHIE